MKILFTLLSIVSFVAMGQSSSGQREIISDLDESVKFNSNIERVDVSFIKSAKVIEHDTAYELVVGLVLEGNLCGSFYKDSFGKFIEEKKGITKVTFMGLAKSSGGFCLGYSRAVEYEFKTLLSNRYIIGGGAIFEGEKIFIFTYGTRKEHKVKVFKDSQGVVVAKVL